MVEEGSHNKKGTSDPDKDFGLPKVEIKPLQPKAVEPAKGKESGAAVLGTTKTAAEKTAGTAVETKEPAQNVVEKKNNYNWLIIVLFLVAVLGGALYYYYYNATLNGGNQAADSEPVADKEAVVPAAPSHDAPPAEEPVEEMETYSLTEINSRIDRPRYFLVVASFIDEDLAKDHSEQLQAQKINTFLVHPYGEIAYYRLAIGQFENFALAAQEIDRVKDNFKENLWVLKY